MNVNYAMENRRRSGEAKENRSFGILYLASRRDAEDEGVQQSRQP
jgi:hypothetical protein